MTFDPREAASSVMRETKSDHIKLLKSHCEMLEDLKTIANDLSGLQEISQRASIATAREESAFWDGRSSGMHTALLLVNRLIEKQEKKCQ